MSTNNDTEPVLNVAGDTSNDAQIDINEPVKPPGPYVLFFRDTVSTITKQNANVEFEEIKKIVETIWNSLTAEHKLVYENRSKQAKIEYQHAMINYLAAKQNQPISISDDNKNIQQIQLETKPDGLNSTSSSNIVDVNNQSNVFATPPTAGPSSGLQTETIAATNAVENNPEDNRKKCLRQGCNNKGVVDPDWEDEYCNSECVVLHCRTVFNSWVQSNKSK